MTKLLSAAALLLSAAITSAGVDPGRFPLGVWYEGGVGAARDNVLPVDPAAAAPVYDKNFADIAAHGITVVVVPNTPGDHHKTLLDAAQKHGLKVIPELGLDGGPTGNAIRDAKELDRAAVTRSFESTLAAIKTHPAFLRLQLLDEPANGHPTRHYAEVAELLRAYDRSVKPFCCLSGPGPAHEFAQTVHPDVVAFDFYPVMVGKADGDPSSLRDFENASAAVVAEAAKVNADAWAVLQCHAITGIHRFPTAGELRGMTWLSVATGNKGVFWFLYQSEHFTPTAMMDGLVDRDFNPRPLWAEVANLTKELRPLLPILVDLRRDPAVKPTVTGAYSAYPFRDPAAHRYVIVVNRDATAERELLVAIPTTTRVTRLPGGSPLPVNLTSNSATVTCPITLPPGGGAVVRLD